MFGQLSEFEDSFLLEDQVSTVGTTVEEDSLYGSKKSSWEGMVWVLWQFWDYLIDMSSSQGGAKVILLLLLVIICLLLLLLLLSCLLCGQCRRRRKSSRKLERQDSASTTVTLETSSPNSWESWSIESKEGGFTNEPHTWSNKDREEAVFVQAAQSWINQSKEEEDGFTQDWEARRNIGSQGAIKEARVGGKEDDFIQVLENIGNKRPISWFNIEGAHIIV